MAYRDLKNFQYTLEYECSDYKKSWTWSDLNLGIPVCLLIG